MKKHLIFGCIASLCILGAAQAAYVNVGEIDLDFCNGSNKLNITMDAGTSTGICMRLTNLSIKTGTVVMGLVDGEMSQGAHSVQACKTDASGVFGQSTTLDAPLQFVLGPEESVIKTGNVVLKSGYVGTMHGCVTFAIVDEDTVLESGQMFSVITRKANTMSITVSGEVKTNVEFGELSLVRNADGTYIMRVPVTNQGTVSTSISGAVTIRGGIGKEITDQFGLPAIGEFSRDINLNSVTLYPGETKEISTQITDLPRLGGSYTLNGMLAYTPVVDATISLPGGDHSFATTREYGIQQYGIWPILLGALIVLLLLLWILTYLGRRARHRKAHHAKANKETSGE